MPLGFEGDLAQLFEVVSQRGLPGRDSIALQDVRDEFGRFGEAQRAGGVLRQLDLDEFKQLTQLPAAPAVAKRVVGE